MAAIRQQKIKQNCSLRRFKMNTYFRITAYHPQEDFSVILDTYGKYQEIWEFSAYLITKKFNIIEVCVGNQIIEEASFPLIPNKSNQIFLRGIGKGKPEVQELEYKDRKSKAISVFDKIYGQYEL